MATHSIKIGVLTSSRADYSYYLPVLDALKNNPQFLLHIIAFGSHTDEKYGATVQVIEKDGFEVYAKLKTLSNGDSPLDIANSYGETAKIFGSFWNEHTDFQWVLCLGDRFEMAAAVAAGIPFGIRFAHFYGGDETLGAIDNVYRDHLTRCASMHFVALESSAERVREITKNASHIEQIGSLSLLNLKKIELLDLVAFCEKWSISPEKPFVLVTCHPETVDYQKNEKYAFELKKALVTISKTHQVLVTMPNADTNGSIFRSMFEDLYLASRNVVLVENLGTQSYFSAMQHAALLIGNTSSGILESAHFNKYVINLGNRQKGRTSNPNVIHVPFDHQSIVENFNQYKDLSYGFNDIYAPKDAVLRIINLLKV
jgi:GDP/UDP-N,N'-diacetylbacillosamine 2-epimerase (hydrolysing)